MPLKPILTKLGEIIEGLAPKPAPIPIPVRKSEPRGPNGR